MTYLIYIQVWGSTKIHITLILPILICAHLGARGHLLKEQLGLVRIFVVQGDWAAPDKCQVLPTASTASQRARKRREKQAPEVRRIIAWETTLCLWASRSPPLGLLAVSDIAQGACGEWQTSEKARALNEEAGAECAICDTFTGILWAPDFSHLQMGHPFS